MLILIKFYLPFTIIMTSIFSSVLYLVWDLTCFNIESDMNVMIYYNTGICEIINLHSIWCIWHCNVYVYLHIENYYVI